MNTATFVNTCRLVLYMNLFFVGFSTGILFFEQWSFIMSAAFVLNLLGAILIYITVFQARK